MEEDGSSGESETNNSAGNPVLPFSPSEDLTALTLGMDRVQFQSVHMTYCM